MTTGYSIPAVLRTGRLLLRPIEIADAQAVFAYGSDRAVTKYLTWPTHRTMNDAVGFVEQRVREYATGPVLQWGITEGDGKPPIGCIGISNISDQHYRGEVGYVLARPFWKRGIMTEALRTVIDASFRYTPLNRIEAHCDPANRASARALEKSGMTFEGMLREVDYYKEAFHDRQMWSILRADWLEARGR
jgi:ribosomal-protein-alanine N-acetyltransferase